MRAVIIAASFGWLLTLSAPANATVLVNATGRISDIVWATGANTVTVGLDHLAGRNTTDPPSLPLKPTLINGQPAPSWFVAGQALQYNIVLTTPTQLLNARGQGIYAYWTNYWDNFGSGWGAFGGEDNAGGSDVSCPQMMLCSAAPTFGNTTVLNVYSQDTAAWYPGINAPWYLTLNWLNNVQIYGELPSSDLNAEYRLFISVGTVPEPATWAMMLLGFGGIGIAMRRRLSTGTGSLSLRR